MISPQASGPVGTSANEDIGLHTLVYRGISYAGLQATTLLLTTAWACLVICCVIFSFS